MIRETIKKCKLELHDTCSNNRFFFVIDYLAPQIQVFKNGLPKGTFNHIEFPVTNDFLMSLTKDCI